MIQISSDKKVILVTGSDGQLGREFRQLANNQDSFEFLFTNRNTMNIGDPDSVDHIFKKFRPDVCINCAAYTAVDLAESNHADAYKINEGGVRNLVEACLDYNCLLFNISTDYVYDSINDRPLIEADSCTPRSVYGQSKRAGEKILEDSKALWFNFRTSWLYSTYGKNFVKSMIRLGKIKDQLNIVSDQIGAPTYARDLAGAIFKIIEQNPNESQSGHYNYCNTGQTNWAEFAREIFRIKQIDCPVNDITTEEFGAPAPRPKWSVMSTEKVVNVFNLELTSWQSSLQQCIENLEQSGEEQA